MVQAERFESCIHSIPARRGARLLTVVPLLCGALAAQASLAWPRRVGVIGEKTIALEEAVAMAVANNNDVEAAGLARRISAFQLTVARAVYEPRLGGETRWQREVLPIASLIGGAPDGRLTQQELAVTPRFQGLIPGSGGSFRADFGSLRQTTDNQFVVLNPQYPTSLTLAVTQPLWRGLRFDDNRRRIEIARRNRQVSDAEFRRRVMDTAAQAAQAWWELSYAHRNARIATEAAELAARQVESNRRQADKGLLAPVEVTEAQIQVYSFQQRAYAAMTALTRAENLLKALMLPGRESPLWWSALIPAGAPAPGLPAAGVEEAVKEALAARPEIEQVRLDGEIQRIEARYWADQAKPQVDLIGLYSSNGLAGAFSPQPANPFTGATQAILERVNLLSLAAGLSPLPPPDFGASQAPPSMVGGYARSLANLFSGNFPTWRAGLQISIPLRNQAAHASLAAAEAEERRSRVRREQLEQSIEADVRNALQAVESASAQAEAAGRERRASEELYESEQRRFRTGVSTVFLVLQRQTAMIEARAKEVRAQADLGQAVAEYQRATGGILRAYGIAITPGP
ncbi:MAG: TolC family protein [Bryobacterales bacterium]|nr:TolC family protein [Bryobacterales bacterium]